MTAKLILKSEDTFNTDVVDFITAGTGYVLLSKGIEIPVPKTKSSVLENPGFSGERIFNKHYSNREIEIEFDIRVANHDTLLDRVRAIQRLIDKAIENSQSSRGERIYLEYKFDDAATPVYFMVLDGFLSLGNLADITAHRDHNLRNNKLTLICEPFARGSLTPIKLRNLLINPGFEWNPTESGRDSGKYIVIDANTKYLSHATAGNFKPTFSPYVLSVGWWVKRGASGGTGDDVIAICGHTTPSWKLWIDASDLPRFSWWNATGVEKTITGTGAIALGSNPVFIGVCMYSTDGTDVVSVLIVNGLVVGIHRDASPTAMRTPVGEFRVGQLDSTNWFEGNIYNGFVAVNINILPFQIVDIYLYGLDHLTGNGLYTENYWALSSTYLKGLWMNEQSSGALTDESGNGNDLTVTGTPTRTANIRKPKGWTLGSDFSSSLTSGLSGGEDISRTGAFALLFNESAGAANMSVSQIANVPAGTIELTLVIWLYKIDGTNSQIEITWEGSTNTITPTVVGWHQYYITKSSGIGSTSTVTIKHTAGAVTKILVDCVALYTGFPFGVQATWLEKTQPYLPYVGSCKMRSTFDISGSFSNYKVPVLDIFDIPGDVDATCRVILESQSQTLGPIRIGFTGAVSNPWAYRWQWRLNTFLPIWANDTDIVTGVSDPSVRSRAETTLIDRIAIPLGRLFPIPHRQAGSFKALIGAQAEQDMISLLRLQSQVTKFPITVDPLKNLNVASSNVMCLDAGLVTWPPDVSISAYRNKLINAVARNVLTVEYTPKLLVSNIADTEIAAPDVSYEWLLLLPTDGGFAITQPVTTQLENYLRPGEQLVIDTVDEEATSFGYIAKPATFGVTNYKTFTNFAGGADVSIFTTGFYLPVGITGKSMFVINYARYNVAMVPFGNFVYTDNNEDMWIEYVPRYLYI